MLCLAAFLPSKSVMNVRLTARVLIFFSKVVVFCFNCDPAFFSFSEQLTYLNSCYTDTMSSTNQS